MLNNCVGFGNYKEFVLLNCFAVLYCAFLAATLLQILIWQLVNGLLIGNSVQFLIICVYALVLGLCCVALVSFHIYLIFKNRTTIEHIQYKDLKKDGELTMAWYGFKYNVDRKENWEQVFGDNPLLYFVPYRNSKGDGVTFPKRE
jgi:palmitoyltransferase